MRDIRGCRALVVTCINFAAARATDGRNAPVLPSRGARHKGHIPTKALGFQGRSRGVIKPPMTVDAVYSTTAAGTAATAALIMNQNIVPNFMFRSDTNT